MKLYYKIILGLLMLFITCSVQAQQTIPVE